MQREPRKIYVGTRLPRGLVRRLDRYAEERDTTRTEVLTDCIQIGLNTINDIQEKAHAKSAEPATTSVA